MESKLIVHLANNQSELLQLQIRLNDIPLIHRWKKALRHNLAKGCQINDRFVGFGRTAELVTEELRAAIKIIEEYSPGTISIDPNLPFNQDTLNRLHRHFEDLIGCVEKISPFFLKAPNKVRKAISDINQKGHELEALKPWEGGKQRPWPQIYVELLGVDRVLMEPDDYKHFSLCKSFGYMYLHYAQLGKQLLDVYRDQDDHVSSGNIQPLKYISGEFDLQFADTPPLEAYKPFLKWVQERNLDPADSTLGMGWVVIGRVDFSTMPFKDLSKEEIVELIGRFPKVKSIHLTDDLHQSLF